MKFLLRSTRCTLIIIVLALILLTFGGCPEAAKTSNRFYELLKLVPAEAKDIEYTITLIDYASLYKDTGITGTTPEKLLDNVLKDEFASRILGWGSYITGYSRHMDVSTIQDKYIGYDATNIDAEIQAGMPPSILVAAIGRFDPKATRDALSHQDEWPSWVKDAYATEEYGGITIHSWGDGLQTHITSRLVPPHLDDLGRAMPLAVTEKYLLCAPSVSVIQLMIDSSQDKADSLADLPEYASIANGLSDLNAYTAMIGDESLANGDPEYEGLYTGPRLKKFTTFGTGLGRDKKGIYMALVLYHDSPDDAAENVLLLKQRIENTTSVTTNSPWTERITDTQINAEGKVLLAKLYTESSGFWTVWFYDRDTLLLHEQ